MTGGALVLIADDDPDIVALVQIALERGGHRTVTAADGEEALAVARADRPALAVLDVAMPRRDGLSVARALRADPATAGIRIIVLTAAVQPADAVAAREAGADAYVKKPFSPKDLAARVDELLA